MGNLESSAKINVDQLQGLNSRELNISRSLTYEQYQQVRRGSTFLILNLQLMTHGCTVMANFIFFTYLSSRNCKQTFKLFSFMGTGGSGQMFMQSWELRDQATVIIK